VTRRAVLDASAAIHLVLDGKDSDAIDSRLGQAHIVTAPDLFTCEVANGLWKYVRRGDMTAGDAASHLEEALALAAGLVPGRMLAQEALAAASTYGHSVYDMMYAVLGRRQRAAVITLDAAFARVLHRMQVEVFCPT
jgi:predicted nucleic acid-binding protein